MWLLHWLPDGVIELVIRMALIVGVVSFVLGLITKWIPFLGPKSIIFRVVGLVLLFPGLYMWGGYGVEMEYRAAAKEWQAKIEILEQKSKEENTKIVEKIVTETKVITQDTAETQYLIEQMREQINKQGCELTDEAVDLYNEGMAGRGK